MTNLRTCGSRSNAIWGRNGGRRARILAAMLAVCVGLVLGAAPTAGACGNGKGSKPQPLASWVD